MMTAHVDGAVVAVYGDASAAVASYDEVAAVFGWTEVAFEAWMLFRPSAFFWWLSVRYPHVLQKRGDDGQAAIVAARAVYDADVAVKPYNERN